MGSSRDGVRNDMVSSRTSRTAMEREMLRVQVTTIGLVLLLCRPGLALGDSAPETSPAPDEPRAAHSQTPMNLGRPADAIRFNALLNAIDSRLSDLRRSVNQLESSAPQLAKFLRHLKGTHRWSDEKQERAPARRRRGAAAPGTGSSCQCRLPRPRQSAVTARGRSGAATGSRSPAARAALLHARVAWPARYHLRHGISQQVSDAIIRAAAVRPVGSLRS